MSKDALFYVCPECGVNRSIEKTKIGEICSCQNCGNIEEPVAHYEKVDVQEDTFIRARDLVVSLIQKESKCKFIKIEYSTGYYLFDFGYPVVLRFRVKGISKYLFGLWFTFNEEDNTIDIKFFGEHDWHIDKFKPTATAISSIKNLSHNDTITLTKFLDLAENGDDMRLLVWDVIYYATEKLTHLKSDKLGMTYGLYRDSFETCGPIWWALRRFYQQHTYGLRDTLINLNSEFQLWLLELRIKWFYKKYGVILKIEKEKEKGCYPWFDGYVCIPEQDLEMEDKRVLSVKKSYISDLWKDCKALRKIEDNNLSGGNGLYIKLVPIDKDGKFSGRIFSLEDDE